MNERKNKLWNSKNDCETKFYKRVLPKGKQGFNDITILATITAILLISAFIIPISNAAFGTGGSNFNSDGLKDELQEDAESVNTISAFGILTTFLSLIFWDVSGSLGLPVWLQLFYTIIFIVAVLTVARNIWIGGGS